jgi:Protein of unknown function (DUF4256)
MPAKKSSSGFEGPHKNSSDRESPKIVPGLDTDPSFEGTTVHGDFGSSLVIRSGRSMAAAIGIELLTEEEYRELQKLGNFDSKTSSWVKTPADIRKLGGALFCDRRYDTVFVYHNGAESYYAARGFRGSLRV